MPNYMPGRTIVEVSCCVPGLVGVNNDCWAAVNIPSLAWMLSLGQLWLPVGFHFFYNTHPTDVFQTWFSGLIQSLLVCVSSASVASKKCSSSWEAFWSVIKCSLWVLVSLWSATKRLSWSATKRLSVWIAVGVYAWENRFIPSWNETLYGFPALIPLMCDLGHFTEHSLTGSCHGYSQKYRGQLRT